MNPYGLLASGAHLTGGQRLPDGIHHADRPLADPIDDMVARRAFSSVSALERFARRLFGRG